MKTQYLTFTAICSAFGVICLSMGFYIQVTVSFWVFLASICVMVSLETGYIRYAIFAYIATTLLSLIFNGFNFVFLLPFITFMGICPIGNAAFEKIKIHRLISYFFKQIWFTASIFLTSSIGAGFMGLSLNNAKSILIIIALTIPSFFFYNLGMVNIQRKIRLFASRRKISIQSSRIER